MLRSFEVLRSTFITWLPKKHGQIFFTFFFKNRRPGVPSYKVVARRGGPGGPEVFAVHLEQASTALEGWLAVNPWVKAMGFLCHPPTFLKFHPIFEAVSWMEQKSQDFRRAAVCWGSLKMPNTWWKHDFLRGSKIGPHCAFETRGVASSVWMNMIWICLDVVVYGVCSLRLLTLYLVILFTTLCRYPWEEVP